MSYTEKQLIETYSNLFEGLSSLGKIELIQNLSKSLKKEKKSKDSKFFKSFGMFASEKSAEEISIEIKKSRSFISKEIKF
jgi:hypothetical protein